MAKKKTLEEDLRRFEQRLNNGFQGLYDGFKAGADPLGMIYTLATGERTIGGSGMRGGTIDGEEVPDVDHKSGEYLAGTILGGAAGLALNAGTRWVVQAGALVANVLYRTLDQRVQEAPEPAR